MNFIELTFGIIIIIGVILALFYNKRKYPEKYKNDTITAVFLMICGILSVIAGLIS